jgi:RNA polymerase sigma-70 factor, ECF subfamily
VTDARVEVPVSAVEPESSVRASGVHASGSTDVDAADVDARAAHLREIVRRYFPDVWRFLRRLGFAEHVVDDAAQELFFVALRRIEDVKTGRERAFLFGAAIRIAKQLQRKRAREVPTESFGGEIDTAATPEEKLDDERARELAYRLLGELEENQRTVFVMYEIEGLTMQDIANVLELPIGTVASRLRRGREDFTARLERHRKRSRGVG